MLETPHVAVGAAIASHIPNPFISIPLALASHFILDITPHWNPHINREIKKFGSPTKQSVNIIRVDSVLALVVGSAIALHATPNYMQAANILACSFVSVLPDVVEIPYYFLHRKDFIVEKWIAWQKSIQNDVSPQLGLTVQSIIIIASLFWVFG
ncbi:hypothetical protein BH10PAT1_BH10PAT1_7010 [soil metagenome]